MPRAAASGWGFGDGWETQPGWEGTVGKETLPQPLGIPGNPQEANWFFFSPVQSRAPMLRHANPGCWGGGSEVAGLQHNAGKLYSQQSCTNEKMNQTSYGADLVLEFEE